MSTTVLATKLYIPPPRPKIVPRLHLITQLNQGLHRKLTLVSAPAGFGKTTLVSEWVTGCGRPVAWLSLDEGDNNLPQFLTYLIAALQMIVPNIGTDTLRMVRSAQPPLNESILHILLNEMASITDPIVLVLDDFHLIEDKEIGKALMFLLERLPTQIHLVITSREDPNLPLARLRARDQLTELRVADLRFTNSESAEFLSQGMGLSISEENISALEARTEGWIAGLQLAAIALQGPMAMQGHKDISSFIKSFTGGHHFVLDYLVEEVLQQQSKEVQDFLLCTSLLDRMCGSLCDAVLADSLDFGQSTLERLEHNNVFIIPLDNERHWYRYHHLFGSLLRQRLGQSRSSDQIAQYHLRASVWFENNNDPAQAFHHAVSAGDSNRAAMLAEKYWQEMNESFQAMAWLGWVKRLPEGMIRSRPVLCTQIAWALMDISEVDASESRLRDAERCLANPADEMVVVAEDQFRSLPARIAIARTYNAQTLQDFPAAVQYAELALELAPNEDHFMRAQTTAILGGTYWANGDLDAACKSMSGWIEHAQNSGNFIFAIASGSGKADILTEQGNLREALRTYQQSLQLAAEHEADSQRVIAHHYLGLAMLYHEMNDDESALQNFQKSLELGQYSTLRDWQYRKCLAQARLKESEGDLKSALDFLDEAKRFYARSLIPNTYPVDAIKTRIHLKQGQLLKAEQWVHTQGLSAKDDLNYLREFEHIILARVLIAKYQSNREEHIILDGLHLLERLLKAAEDQKRMGSMLQILMVTALAHHAAGSTTQAFASLERSLQLAAPEGYIRTFVNEGEPMRALLSAFQSWLEKQPRSQYQELRAYISKLLSVFAQPTGTSKPGSGAVEALSQRELEVLRLIAQGLSNLDISKRLFLALNTVKGHNRIIFDKLHVQNRTEAVARAREL
ncbi:MAG TPA: LuxR C-terminal-related transcriptional regulator, partial [Anaerolineales bacterium]|nr:LuxR C-terminal-related transcriptional regulator [Anaerolineales bacterium]